MLEAKMREKGAGCMFPGRLSITHTHTLITRLLLQCRAKLRNSPAAERQFGTSTHACALAAPGARQLEPPKPKSLGGGAGLPSDGFETWASPPPSSARELLGTRRHVHNSPTALYGNFHPSLLLLPPHFSLVVVVVVGGFFQLSATATKLGASNFFSTRPLFLGISRVRMWFL